MEARLTPEDYFTNDEWADILTQDFREMRMTLFCNPSVKDLKTRDELNRQLIELIQSILKVKEMLVIIRQQNTSLSKQLGIAGGTTPRTQ